MSALRFPHIAQRLFNTPLLIHPAKIEIITAALADRLGLSNLIRSSGETVTLASVDLADVTPASGDSPYAIVDGVAIIQVEGTLVAKLGTLHPYSGMTGYDGLRTLIGMALADPEVKAILLDIDSHGGEAAGCFDLAEDIYQARGIKPMWASLSEVAYSAAFALASATDRILVPRTGGTGSVGVLCAHVELSKALSKEGITVRLFTFGARKADGNQYTPMEEETAARYQADVDEMGELFCDVVARNLGILPAKVRATEAGTYFGRHGVEVGFAHAVMSPAEAFQALQKEIR